MVVTIALAGRFTVHRDGVDLPDHEVGSRKARDLLRLLAVRRRHIVHIDAIVDVLWASAPREPANSVATLVSRLRAALGPGVVTGDRQGYRLGADVRVDLDVAAARLAEARLRLEHEPAMARIAAAAALELVSAGGAAEPAEWAAPVETERTALLGEARLIGAEAALRLAEPRLALELANAAIAGDPYDEAAYRLVMRAHADLGAPARAVATYERLREVLAEELGIDPSAETRDLHVAMLREVPSSPRRFTAPPGHGLAGAPGHGLAGASGHGLAGRDDELGRLTAHWGSAGAGRPALVLLVGEAGIGKTTLSRALMDVVVGVGGRVLSARCYEAERSLFLQPIADALGQHAAGQSATTLRSLVGDGEAALSQLVPEIAAVLGRSEAGGTPEAQRQQAYRAVSDYLGRLAGTPTLLVLDDLHQSGLTTVELLHYIARHAGTSRLLVVATVRSGEGAPAIDMLADVSTVEEIGPLDGMAVQQLATEAGYGDQAQMIMSRTGGHPLFVAETLRGLSSGVVGVPSSLQVAVLARVRRAGDEVGELLRAASVLGATVELEPLARLLDIPPIRASRLCEQAATARLLVIADRTYEFANDLVREVLYASMPSPTRLAFHRQAADLLTHRPEAVATHAMAVGDLARASRAWLLAGEEAERSLAAADADVMFGQAIATAGGDPELKGRALLARGRVRDVLARYDEADEDLREAVAVARDSGDRRLEMLGHLALGSDIRIPPGSNLYDVELKLERALGLAMTLGDRTVEAQVLARWAIYSCNRLDFVAGQEQSRRAAAAARLAHDDVALVAALDCGKTSHAYLGDHVTTAVIIDELEPLLRRQHDLYRLQWLVQEQAYASVATGDWDTAIDRLVAALELNRRSGYRAHEPWFASRVAWVYRLRGDLDGALDWARRSVELATPGRHAWWWAAAQAELGLTLLEVDDRVAARRAFEVGLVFAPTVGAESYRLRCLGPLAACTDDPAVLPQADAMLSAIVTPPGYAWLLGADAYVRIAEAWRAAGDEARASAVLGHLRDAATRTGWAWLASL